jgi:hypothetical protein
VSEIQLLPPEVAELSSAEDIPITALTAWARTLPDRVEEL